MTDDEILALVALTSNEPTDAEMIEFARAIAAKERKACAELCETASFLAGGDWCAEQIRARGKLDD